MDAINEAKFRELQKAAATIPHGSPVYYGQLYNLVDYALNSALGNAEESEGYSITADREAFFGIAYDSISSTSAFCENQDVRSWFIAQGYRY